MKIHNSEKRLQKFWGKVDEKHIRLIEEWVTGNHILDMGAGYGATTGYLSKKKDIHCVAMDCDPEMADKAKNIFPGINYVQANAEHLPFEAKTFDTIILRDALHHFLAEADIEKVKGEIARVAKDQSRVIFFDPNVNWVLKSLRWLSNHKDEECHFEQALGIMQSMGFTIIHKGFSTIFSLPLSGGYVGINFVPNNKWIQNGILKTERFLERKINSFHVQRNLFWRYIIVGEKRA